MQSYTRVVPYVCGVTCRVKLQLGFRRLKAEEPPPGLVNRRFQIVGFVIAMSKKWWKRLSRYQNEDAICSSDVCFGIILVPYIRIECMQYKL